MNKIFKIFATFVFMGLFIIACKSNIEKNSAYINQCTPLIIEFLRDPDSFYSTKHTYNHFDGENREYLKLNFSRVEYDIVDSQITEYGLPEKHSDKVFLEHLLVIKSKVTTKLFYLIVVNIHGIWELHYCGFRNPKEFGKINRDLKE